MSDLDFIKMYIIREYVLKEIKEWLKKKRKEFVTEFSIKHGIDYERLKKEKRKYRERVINADGEDFYFWREKYEEVSKKMEEAEEIKKEGIRNANRKLLTIVREETKKIALKYNPVTEEDANRLASQVEEMVLNYNYKNKLENKPLSQKGEKYPSYPGKPDEFIRNELAKALGEDPFAGTLS